MDSIGKSSTARTRAFTIQPAALLGIALFGGYLFNVKLH
jgi:Na+/H+-translocating membrane pyrophosphatase